MRYYQGAIDVHTLERGTDYSKLPRSIIVFICSFDLYDKAMPVYDFENRCKQDTDLLLGDETRKVIVNLNGNTEHLDSDLKALYNYLRNHEVQDDFTRELDEAVCTARKRYEWGTEYNMWRANEMKHQIELEEAREEGREEGRAEGKEEGIESTIDILIKLKTGESKEDLLAEGIPQEFIDRLLKLI